jgi:hypothetical protein
MPCRKITLMLSALLLAACGSSDNGNTSAAPLGTQLQSVVQQDANGQTTTLSLFDYDGNGALIRIRNYDNAGADGQWGTEDDGMAGYVDCAVTNGSPALADPPSEDGNFEPGLVHTITNCNLPQLAGEASIITSTYYDDPGPDGIWLTPDDIVSEQSTLQGSAGGSSYHDHTNCDAPCTADSFLTSVYEYRSDGHLDSIKTGNLTTHFDTQGRWLDQESSPDFLLSLVPVVIRPVYWYFSYQAEDANRQLESFSLMATPDVAQMLEGSSIWFLSAGPTIELYGQTFVTFPPPNAHPSRLLSYSGNRLDTITNLTDAGPDKVWGTADDAISLRIQLNYLPPS